MLFIVSFCAFAVFLSQIFFSRHADMARVLHRSNGALIAYLARQAIALLVLFACVFVLFIAALDTETSWAQMQIIDYLFAGMAGLAGGQTVTVLNMMTRVLRLHAK